MNATCFYVGPIIDAILETDAAEIFNATLDYDIVAANVSDPFTEGPVLQAYQRCVTGPASLQEVPSWIYQTLGRLQVVSIDSVESDDSDDADSESDAAIGNDSVVSSLVTEGGRQYPGQVPSG